MHHAVWESPNGGLLDVTEKYSTDPVKSHSVFVPDDSINIDLEKPTLIQSKHLALREQTEVQAFIAAYRQKYICERARADLLYKYGYRNQIQAARAAGRAIDPSSLTFPAEFFAESTPLRDAYNQAMNALGSAINALKALDAADVGRA